MENQYQTTIEVCCHQVGIRYWDFKHEVTDHLIERLEEEGRIRAKHMICDDYWSGELHCVYFDPETETYEEIRGWWEIITEEYEP